MNILPIEKVAHLLQCIDQPARLQILLAIGGGETCVCHLEATFGWRQAYLSQHLMALREAGIVIARREGRFMYYRMTYPSLLRIIQDVAELQELRLPELAPSSGCACPNCNVKQGKPRNKKEKAASYGEIAGD